jgi:hypothetical protein
MSLGKQVLCADVNKVTGNKRKHFLPKKLGNPSAKRGASEFRSASGRMSKNVIARSTPAANAMTYRGSILSASARSANHPETRSEKPAMRA